MPRLTNALKLDVTIERVPLDRDGYTKEKYAKYFGTGEPLFRWRIEDLEYDNHAEAAEDGYKRAWSKKEVLDLLRANARTAPFFAKYARPVRGYEK